MQEQQIVKMQNILKMGQVAYKIFNPAGLSIEMAKQIWNRSEFKREFMEFLPKFDMMKKYARLHISNGLF